MYCGSQEIKSTMWQNEIQVTSVI